MNTDTNPLQERIARALYENAEYYGPEPTQPHWDSRDDEERGEWMEIAAAVLPIIARLEAQSDIRGRAVIMYRERAREAEAERDWNLRSSRLAKEERIQANARAESAEARIKAVQDLIDQADTAGDWAITCSRLQWAIDGTAPQPVPSIGGNVTYEDALAILRDGWPITPEGLTQIAAHIWDEGHAACDRDWAFTGDLSTPDEDRQPRTNPYRASEAA